MRQLLSRLIATPAVQMFIRAVCTHSARVRVLQQTLAGLQPHGISPVEITAEMIRFPAKNRSKVRLVEHPSAVSIWNKRCLPPFEDDLRATGMAFSSSPRNQTQAFSPIRMRPKSQFN